MPLRTPNSQLHLSLAQYEDAELADLARTWRQRASRGDREAFGIAHALEREVRQRALDRQPVIRTTSAPARTKPWWSFWRSAGRESTRCRPEGGVLEGLG